MRRILHLDMDAFFAAVEEKRNPALKGLPVVVGGGGDPSKRGVVSTASYAARQFGIRSGMPLRTAHRLCPEAVFLPVDYQAYAEESKKVKAILAGISPVMEDVGIDEAFLDLSGIPRTSEDIVKEIKERIAQETGLTCSIGIAPNKLLAKIASDLQKPDGFTVMEGPDVERLVWPLPVRKLWGVGPKTETALRHMGISTIGELAAMTLDDLTGAIGGSYARYLYEASRGIDESPLVTHWEPKSVGRETTFQRDIGKWQEIARALADLTREVAGEMKEEGYRGQTVTLKIRFSDFETLTRARTLDAPTDSVEELRKAAFECLGRVKLAKRVRLIGMRVSKLMRRE